MLDYTNKEKLAIALSSYCTWKSFTYSEWVQCKEDMKHHKLMMAVTPPKDTGLQRRVG